MMIDVAHRSPERDSLAPVSRAAPLLHLSFLFAVSGLCVCVRPNDMRCESLFPSPQSLVITQAAGQPGV